MSETPEQLARRQIDAQLVAAGWTVQGFKQFNPAASRGIALLEAPLKSGKCDYLLLVDRKAVGVVEAKRTGALLSRVAEQSGHYAENLPEIFQSLAPGRLPFLSVVEELESAVTANLQIATRLRQSILQKAFTGGLTE